MPNGNIITRHFTEFTGKFADWFGGANEWREDTSETISDILDGFTDWLKDRAWPVILTLAAFVYVSLLSWFIWDRTRGAVDGDFWQKFIGGLIGAAIVGLIAAPIIALGVWAMMFALAVTLRLVVAPVLLFVPVTVAGLVYGLIRALILLWQLTALIPLFVLFLGTRASELYREIFHTCPSVTCANQPRRWLDLPLHVCPQCGADNPKLWPNLQGVIWHECVGCGHRLPALGILGRRKLRRRCTVCKGDLTASGATERLIAVTGPATGGKTCFITMAAHDMANGERKNRWGLQAKAESTADGQLLEAYYRTLRRGQALPATANVDTAIVFLGRVRKGLRRMRIKLYLFDHPGEEAQTETRREERQKYYHVLNGIVLIADPESWMSMVLSGESAGNGNPFTQSVQTLINWAERNIPKGADGRMARRLAVVLAKADLEAVRNKIGDIRRRPISGKVVKEALCDWGHGHSLALLEESFAAVEYFACSALGRSLARGEEGEVNSYGVLEPIGWILTGKR